MRRATPAAIQTIFEALWTTGADPAHPGTLAALASQLGVPRERLAEAGVKEALRANTAQAVQRGVFGVPTLFIQGQVFWGALARILSVTSAAGRTARYKHSPRP